MKQFKTELIIKIADSDMVEDIVATKALIAGMPDGLKSELEQNIKTRLGSNISVEILSGAYEIEGERKEFSCV